MSLVIIVHGTKGSPQENWFPWLKVELERSRHKVIVPEFPTPYGQKLSNWLEVFEEQVLPEILRAQEQNIPVILVGHSVGATFLLSVLERWPAPVPAYATILVAGFTGKLGHKDIDHLNSTFAEKSFNWPKIRMNAGKVFVYHSDNDPKVPLEKGKELAAKLGVELTIVPGAGHFNAAAGYTQFEKLRDTFARIAVGN